VTATKCILAISISMAQLMPIPVRAAEIAIANQSPLVFGSFAAGSGGTVTVSTSGACSAGGGVIIIVPDCSSAEFMVTGDPDFTYLIELPADDFVTLTGPGNNMVISNFVSNPAEGANGLLSSGGSQILSVGATLNVANNQAAGSYSGSFSVIVQYN
jgi:hypothetical protein